MHERAVRGREGPQGHDRHDRLAQRQGDLPEHAELAGAVDQARLVQLRGETVEEPLQQEDPVSIGHRRQDQCEKGIHQTDRDAPVDHPGDLGDHVSGKHDRDNQRERGRREQAQALPQTDPQQDKEEHARRDHQNLDEREFLDEEQVRDHEHFTRERHGRQEEDQDVMRLAQAEARQGVRGQRIDRQRRADQQDDIRGRHLHGMALVENELGHGGEVVREILALDRAAPFEELVVHGHRQDTREAHVLEAFVVGSVRRVEALDRAVAFPEEVPPVRVGPHHAERIDGTALLHEQIPNALQEHVLGDAMSQNRVPILVRVGEILPPGILRLVDVHDHISERRAKAVELARGVFAEPSLLNVVKGDGGQTRRMKARPLGEPIGVAVDVAHVVDGVRIQVQNARAVRLA